VVAQRTRADRHSERPPSPRHVWQSQSRIAGLGVELIDVRVQRIDLREDRHARLRQHEAEFAKIASRLRGEGSSAAVRIRATPSASRTEILATPSAMRCACAVRPMRGGQIFSPPTEQSDFYPLPQPAATKPISGQGR